MNNRDKLQKFSIRKYAIGTFSTVIATLVFVGFNPGQAHANEVSQNQKVIEQQEDSQIDEDNSNSKAHQLYSQVDNNQSRSSENNQPNALDKTTLTNMTKIKTQYKVLNQSKHRQIAMKTISITNLYFLKKI